MSDTPSGEPGRPPADPERTRPEGTYGASAQDLGGPPPYGTPPAYWGPPTPYPGGLPPVPYGPPPPRTNPYAIASLVCSLAGLVTGISVIAGIVLGHIALNQIKQTGEEGRTLAIAGLAVGYGLLALGILFVIGIIFFMALAGGWMTTMGGETATL
jgi:hypothetical protein